MSRSRGFSCFVVALCVAAAASSVAQTPLNLIYFGNSFTNATCCGSTASVPTVVSEIAFLAGNPRPVSRNASSNGQSLDWHTNNSTNLISAGVPANRPWDFVILQDFSTQPTRLGNLSLHLSSSLEMYQLVKQHSPDVTAVMYQTWARGYGHSYYAGANPAFPGGPTEMHQELRDGYQMSTANINAVEGAGSAILAPAGDAWAEIDFQGNFYASDIYHASNRGTMMSALSLYAAIYGDATVTDIPLSGLFTTLGISPADGQLLVSAVQSTLIPEPTSAVLVVVAAQAAATRRRA